MILGVIDDFLDQPLRTKVTMLVVLLVCGTALDWTFVY